MLDLPASYSEAKRLGKPAYFTGIPCIRGHIDQRRVLDRRCRTCGRDQARERARKLDRSVHAERVRNWWKNHPERKRPPYNPDGRKGEAGEIARAYARKYHKLRKNDPLYILPLMLRTRTRLALYDNYKSGSAIKDLGCSIPELKIWLEDQFQSGMSWDNYGPAWHIDHRQPLSAFDLTDRAQFLEACHYTNLQPLFALDNLKKGGVRRPRRDVA